MTFAAVSITPYDDALHRDQVIALWRQIFGYETAHNAPALSIDRKVAVNDGLFFVALDGARDDAHIIGTIMAGYDGHRGWIYSLAVTPERRRNGIGAQLLAAAEQALISRGCLKINLQILSSNGATRGFYEKHGYQVEERISMGKRLLT